MIKTILSVGIIGLFIFFIKTNWISFIDSNNMSFSNSVISLDTHSIESIKRTSSNYIRISPVVSGVSVYTDITKGKFYYRKIVLFII